MAILLTQSTTEQVLVFLLVDSSDHITGKTGLSPTVTLSKAGGSFASPSGSVSEIANGWYKVAANATDTGTLGPLILHATGTGADPVDVLYEVVAWDVQDAVRGGLSALPNAAANASGGLITSGSGAGQLTVNGSGKLSGVVLVDTITTYTGNTVQTGDAYSRIGAAGAGLTALGDTRIAHLDADVSSRATTAAIVTGGTITVDGDGFVEANVKSINDSPDAAPWLQEDVNHIVQVLVDAATNSFTPTTTTFDTNVETFANDTLRGRILWGNNGDDNTRTVVKVVSSTPIGSTTRIVVYPPLPIAPSNGDNLIIKAGEPWANVEMIHADMVAAINLMRIHKSLRFAAVDSVTDGGEFVVTGLEEINRTGQFLVFEDGTANAGECRKITSWAYDAGNTTLTFEGAAGNLDAPFPETPVAADACFILGRG